MLLNANSKCMVSMVQNGMFNGHTHFLRTYVVRLCVQTGAGIPVLLFTVY